jgi:hypothetical protein
VAWDLRRADRSWLLVLPVLTLAAAGGQGCAGGVGPCGGQGCPPIPNCRDNEVTCDPEHVCWRQVCEGAEWICGVADGRYQWQSQAAPCDDGNPCTTGDVCADGHCVGTPVSCTSPPSPSCKDAATLQTWSGGVCNANGQCDYSASSVSCPLSDCQVDKCASDPCLGITCQTPPGLCRKTPGTCNAADGKCGYDLVPVGTPCTLADACQTAPTCDASGNCVGTPKVCARPNATAGTCVAGECQGFTCVAGWGNCNNDWSDGCETKLDSTSHCGQCGNACAAAANATPVCSGGGCALSCKAPWQDCDKVYANGCEIPVGQSNHCSDKGLVSWSSSNHPCGTPHCGTSSRWPSFKTWHCAYCSHCYKFSNGYAWCLWTDKQGKGPGGVGEFEGGRCSTCCNESWTTKVCDGS